MTNEFIAALERAEKALADAFTENARLTAGILHADAQIVKLQHDGDDLRARLAEALKQLGIVSAQFGEARAENERLEAALKASLHNGSEAPIGVDRWLAAQDEIERLTAERDQYLRHSVEYGNEVERLKADMAGDQQRLFHYEGEIERLTDVAKKLQAALALAASPAEIERLTTALQISLTAMMVANALPVVAHVFDFSHAIAEARRALEQKP
jgi:chromosome segregation ATPase